MYVTLPITDRVWSLDRRGQQLRVNRMMYVVVGGWMYGDVVTSQDYHH